MYHNSNPKNFHKKLQNVLGKIIEFIGLILGFMCYQKTRTNYEDKSFGLKLWSVSILLIQGSLIFTMCVIQTVYLAPVPDFNGFLDQILEMITVWVFTVSIMTNSYIFIKRRKFILNLMNCARDLYFELPIIIRNSKGTIKPIYQLLLKIVLDFLLVIATSYFLISFGGPMMQFNMSTLLLFLLYPIILSTYCFTITMYYASFLYATSLMEKIHYQLVLTFDNQEIFFPRHYLRNLSHRVQLVIYFAKNVNKVFQWQLLWFLLEAFIGMVNQVKYKLIHNIILL